jgi:hypothetical protein
VNADDLIKEMQAFDREGAEFMTPIQYSKIRPILAPQIYGWMKRGLLTWKHCDCGRRVINVEEADELMRSKGRLPPLKGGDDGPSSSGNYSNPKAD